MHHVSIQFVNYVTFCIFKLFSKIIMLSQFVLTGFLQRTLRPGGGGCINLSAFRNLNVRVKKLKKLLVFFFIYLFFFKYV